MLRVLLILLFSYNAFAGKKPDVGLLEKYLSEKYKKIDIDGDGVEDLVKTYKAGRLVKVDFSLSRTPAYRSSTEYMNSDKVVESRLMYSKLTSKVITLKSEKELLIDKTIFYPTQSKLVTTFRGKFVNNRKYVLKRKQWHIVSN